MAMLAQVSTPVLGVVENMSGYVCPACGTTDALFGAGGADGLATRFGVPLLARIPIAPAVRVAADAGTPIVTADPTHATSRLFRELAGRVAAEARARMASMEQSGLSPART
jgi:ATP-binding protein involved in chromosome partitioning